MASGSQQTVVSFFFIFHHLHLWSIDDNWHAELPPRQQSSAASATVKTMTRMVPGSQQAGSATTKTRMAQQLVSCKVSLLTLKLIADNWQPGLPS